jgi:outer membrane putative beta-barrel porin/alpha-amylase
MQEQLRATYLHSVRTQVLLSLIAFPLTAYRSPLTAVQIQDNSFLIEEAYNQEAGIVQHINTFALSSGQDWGYTFTQEWPLGGIRHQLSYTIPVERSGDTGTGLGDVALNYRYQLAGNPEARTVAAPRLSLLLPTGNDERGRGAGGLGIQANLPVTLVVDSSLVTHWNAGATITPSARNALGDQATTTGFDLGASLIWLTRPSFNLLVETLWLSEQSVVGEGNAVREESVALSPGMRMAFNVAGGLQIVPGIAYTIYLTPDDAEDQAFLYLSFEHPFKRQ